MGFNTVVLILNDHLTSLRECPHALMWAITHPPHSEDETELHQWWMNIYSVAKEHGEDPRGLRGGLRVLPTFHADDAHLLVAGGNLLKRISLDKKEQRVNVGDWQLDIKRWRA